jgi:hypothetical protein
MKQQLAAL